MPTPQLERFDGSPANWTGPQLAASPERWIHDLTSGEIADIDALLARHGRREDDLINFTRNEVEIPALGPVLVRIRHELLNGCGIALIRGLPVERYTMREAATAYWAIGLHLGEAVSQNAKGHALGHVRDLGFDITKPSARGYQTAERLSYHTDSGDVVGLLSLRTAKSGGLSSAVSSTAIYHVLLDRHPDLLAVLLEPTWRDRRDEIPERAGPWYRMPVFMPHKGRLFAHYVRSAIHKAQRFPDVPRITPAQVAAFDKLDELAASPELRLDMEFRPGDIQLLCNRGGRRRRRRYVEAVEALSRLPTREPRKWLGHLRTA
jgi:Taurine catabolism dioxygenase TauD, TfdA family